MPHQDHLLLELRSYQQESHQHQHDYHQLVLPAHGCLELDVEGRGGLVQAGQLAVIAAGNSHGFAAPGDNAFVVANVPASLAPQLASLPAFLPLDASLLAYVEFLRAELSRPAAAEHSRRQMLLLLTQLLAERAGADNKLDRRVAAARAVLDVRFAEDISLAQLAAAAHLSVRQLSELFRRQLGMSPGQYQLEQRMQHGWLLLEQGGLPVQQVAEQCGYASLSAFSDRFRRHFGIAPSHFRHPAK
ncbi:transcriptional regulator, AraC family [Aquitalea magnusonii]|uniref:Transcriptional regulator, AraC family n=1 Tax=Aquitalea magnusonii TaxID=332411 RepID=A0A3G9GPB3_9NEIS|nr:AraC family transcriptional regulator [Aquitalea magnusonii]BBF87482.1 transcriptional regulator, AraC family [Aquitalea magnusonii]